MPAAWAQLVDDVTLLGPVVCRVDPLLGHRAASLVDAVPGEGLGRRGQISGRFLPVSAPALFAHPSDDLEWTVVQRSIRVKEAKRLALGRPMARPATVAPTMGSLLTLILQIHDILIALTTPILPSNLLTRVPLVAQRRRTSPSRPQLRLRILLLLSVPTCATIPLLSTFVLIVGEESQVLGFRPATIRGASVSLTLDFAGGCQMATGCFTAACQLIVLDHPCCCARYFAQIGVDHDRLKYLTMTIAIVFPGVHHLILYLRRRCLLPGLELLCLLLMMSILISCIGVVEFVALLE